MRPALVSRFSSPCAASISRLGFGGLLLSTALAGAAPAQYPVGFSWNHGIDFQPGTTHGTSDNNPFGDAVGNPTWAQVVHNGGGGLGSGTPWYTVSPTPMVWDDDFLGFGANWVRADDTGPIINGDYFGHALFPAAQYAYTSSIQWNNPTGTDVRVALDGHLVLNWEHYGGGDPSVLVDVVLVHEDVSAGTHNLLSSHTIPKPNGANDFLVDLGEQTLVVEPNDRISYSIRAQNALDLTSVIALLEHHIRIVCPEGEAGCSCQRPIPTPVAGPEATIASTTHPAWNRRVADSFDVASLQKLDRLTWWGSNFDHANPGGCFQGAPKFDVTIYEDNGGLPGASVFGPISAQLGPELSQQLTGFDATRFGATIFPRRFTYEFPTAPVLPTGTYWLEIVDDSPGDCYWSWLNSDEGDQRAFSDVGMDGYTAGEQIAFDLAFCPILSDATDCNFNGVDDAVDIALGTSQDVGGDGIPDECDGVGTAVCFGDGSGTPCPCANGATGAGCTNSETSGAILSSTGNAFFGADTFGLVVTSIPAGKPGLCIKGSTLQGGGLGNPVGNGLLCASPELRSQVLVSNGSGDVAMTNWRNQPFGTYPGAANLGSTSFYQWWFRDPADACSGQGFNFSNAWSVIWQ